MKAEAGIISQLNIILKNELTAINQYFLHSRMIKDWELRSSSLKNLRRIIGEMKHAIYHEKCC